MIDEKLILFYMKIEVKVNEPPEKAIEQIDKKYLSKYQGEKGAKIWISWMKKTDNSIKLITLHT